MKGLGHIYMLLEHSNCILILRALVIGFLRLTTLVRNVVVFFT